MLQWPYMYVSSVCSKCFICFTDVHCKCFILMLHMFHTYVASVLSGCYICLQWVFSRVFKCFACVSNTYWKCFSYFIRMLQVFYPNISKIDRDVEHHVAMWPPWHNPLLQLLGRHACSWGVEGWNATRQRARKVDGDGARGAGVPTQHARAASIGGAGNPDRGTKWGRSFLGAAASSAETDCSHGRPDAFIHLDVRALAVSYGKW